MIKIHELPTAPPPNIDKDQIKDETDELCERLGDLQRLLLANESHAVLVVFQGMDASGKDGAVRKVFRDCSHHGIHLHSFKKPTDLEMAHDFLWRIHQKCPARGEITIFNRSHYEDVLIQRVHGWIDHNRVKMRMDAINAFEKLLAEDNNTLVLKFFLNISHDQQKIELEERLNEEDKYYKHNDGDWKERKHWDKYMEAYQDVLNWSEIPWTVTPVDERWYRDYIVVKRIVGALESLNMKWPKLDTEDFA